jgi:hypothetical protein
MELKTALALRSTLDSVIGGRELDEGTHEVNDTVTVSVVGIITKGQSSDKAPGLPTRQALAYILDGDENFQQVLSKALIRAQNVKDEDATARISEKIKRGLSLLEIIESKVVEKLELDRVPVKGATKVKADMVVLSDGELMVAASPFAVDKPR